MLKLKRIIYMFKIMFYYIVYNFVIYLENTFKNNSFNYENK